jgi:hypothetical protein
LIQTHIVGFKQMLLAEILEFILSCQTKFELT